VEKVSTSSGFFSYNPLSRPVTVLNRQLNSHRRRNVVTLLAIVGHIYRLDSLNIVPPAHDLTTSHTVTGPQEHQ
jgi:hypothetical protein